MDLTNKRDKKEVYKIVQESGYRTVSDTININTKNKRENMPKSIEHSLLNIYASQPRQKKKMEIGDITRRVVSELENQ